MKKGVFISVLILFSGLLLTAYVNNSIHESEGSLHAESDRNANDTDTNENEDEDEDETESEAEGAYTVVIDPGHGGKDKGATSEDGRHEKEFTLSLGKVVENMLDDEQDIRVLMTREEDEFISQESRERPEFANDHNADLYVSLHGNTFDDSSVSGTETHYYSDENLSLAEMMQDHVTEATGFSDRGVKQQNLFVLRDTNMPAVLLEVGYITNPENEKDMFKEDFQQEVASAIVDGIKEYRDDTESFDDEEESYG